MLESMLLDWPKGTGRNLQSEARQGKQQEGNYDG